MSARSLFLLLSLVVGREASADDEIGVPVEAPSAAVPVEAPPVAVPTPTPPASPHSGVPILPVLTAPPALGSETPTESLISAELSRLDAVVGVCAAEESTPRVHALVDMEILEQRMADRMDSLLEALKTRPDMPTAEFEALLARADAESRLESDEAGRKPVPGDPSMAILRKTESERLLGEFQGRLALAALGSRPQLAREYERHANASLKRASEALKSADPAMRASETPRLLSRLVETQLSLEQFRYLSLGNESQTQAIRAMNAVIDRVREEHKPQELENLQLGFLEAEAFLSMAEASPGDARSSVYVQEDVKLRYRSLIKSFDASLASLDQMPDDTPGKSRLSAQLHVLDYAGAFFGGGASEVDEALEHLKLGMKHEDPTERESAERAADYLLDSELGTHLGHRLMKESRDWGERPNFSRKKHLSTLSETAKRYDAATAEILGTELDMKLKLPKYRELIAAEGVMGSQYEELLEGISAVAEKQRARQADPKLYSEEEIGNDLSRLDITWTNIQCARLGTAGSYPHPDLVKGRVQTPFRTLKVDLRPCLEAKSAFDASVSYTYKVIDSAIQRKLKVDLGWVAGEFAVDVGMAVGSGGLTLLAKKPLQMGLKKVGRNLLRKSALKPIVVKSAVRSASFGGGLLLTDVTVGSVHGMRNFVQAGFSGDWDFENIKRGISYLNPNVNAKEHATRLFATAMAGQGMSILWRRAAATRAGIAAASSAPLAMGLETVKASINSVFTGAVGRAAEAPFRPGQTLLGAAQPLLDHNTWIDSFRSSLRGRMVDMAATRTRGVGERYIGASFIERMGDVRLRASDLSRLSSLGTCVASRAAPPPSTPASPAN